MVRDEGRGVRDEGLGFATDLLTTHLFSRLWCRTDTFVHIWPKKPLCVKKVVARFLGVSQDAPIGPAASASRARTSAGDFRRKFFYGSQMEWTSLVRSGADILVCRVRSVACSAGVAGAEVYSPCPSKQRGAQPSDLVAAKRPPPADRPRAGIAGGKETFSY
jgi:hypothetical protein